MNEHCLFDRHDEKCQRRPLSRRPTPSILSYGRTETAHFINPPLRSFAAAVSESQRLMLRKQEIMAVYDQGVESVATTIRQLYEMIEADDELVYALVTVTTAAQLQKIERLSARIALHSPGLVLSAGLH